MYEVLHNNNNKKNHIACWVSYHRHAPSGALMHRTSVVANHYLCLLTRVHQIYKIFLPIFTTLVYYRYNYLPLCLRCNLLTENTATFSP